MARKMVVAAAAVVALATACWPSSPTTGPRLGDPPPDGHHYAWSSSNWQWYGCTSIPGLDRCADSVKIGIGKYLGVDPEPGSGGGMPAYRVDWKDPSRLGTPPAGSPGIVLRIEFANTIYDPSSANQTCNPPGGPAKQVFAPPSADSNVTAVNCTVTADKRMLIDFGLKRKVGYRIGRCFDEYWQNGEFDLRFEPPSDGAHSSLGWCPVEWQTG